MIKDKELKQKWFDYFQKHGFKKIDGYSIIPETDTGVLFTTAGMHPLVPYLLGKKHPVGNKIVNIQNCLRTTDIDEVGDNRHLTCFEMLGCWTLGECDKKNMIKLSYDFFTKELGISGKNVAVSVFAGDENSPRDDVSANAWKENGIDKVFFLPKKNNWWSISGGEGPCGPDTEMFLVKDQKPCSNDCSPACDCGRYVEFWNDVFMEYQVKKIGEKPVKLDKPNIDTGMGLERTLMVINGYESVYEIDGLKRALNLVKSKSKNQDERASRIIVDHIRATTFVLGDEKCVTPSNIGAGYILRRLIRRSVNFARKLQLDETVFTQLVDMFVDEHKEYYPHLEIKREFIKDELNKEIQKFSKALEGGYREFEKVISVIERHKEFAQKNGEKVENIISGKSAFRLYDTFGFPLELTKEIASERGYKVDEAGFDEMFKRHQELSRTASAGTFKGGLADDSEKTIKYHTACHLLLAGLRKLDAKVEQKGSNLTAERLRFDFNFPRKLEKNELEFLENFVNDVIKQDIPVKCEEKDLKKALEEGAVGSFQNKYGEIVKVYTIGNISKEICGGPHVESTGCLGKFKIIKEESSSAGVRRIKAVLE